MSLINQMLSDLDQRQALGIENDTNSAAALSAPFNITTDTATNKNLSFAFKIGFYIVILLLLGITSYYSYLSYKESNKNIKPQVASNKQITKIIPPKTVLYNKVKNTSPSRPNKPEAKKQAPLISTALAVLPPTVNHKTYPIDNDAETEAEEIIEPASNDINSVRKQPRQLSNTQQAELAYQKGYQLLRQNKVYSAEAKLLLALEHNVKHIKAREMLVGLYLKTGRKVEAETLLNKGLLYLPGYSNFTKLVARLLLDNNQVDKAVKTLLNHRPAISADPNFYALLAASYQRQNNHAAAANTYVQLLKINPREGIWWVGMGISLEALNKNKEALDAYEKARQTGTLNTRIANYSNQRLKILNTTADTQ